MTTTELTAPAPIAPGSAAQAPTPQGAPTHADVIAAIPEQDDTPPDQYRTTTGVVLRLKKVPPFLITDAQAKLVEPTPPKVWIEDKNTHEDNLADPAFNTALGEYRRKLGELSSAIFLARGTDVVSKPDNIPQWDDNQWSQDLEDLGIDLDIPKVGKRRYYLWLKYEVITDADDLGGILQKLNRLGGITMEVDVAAAMAGFPGDEARPDAAGVSPEAERGLGASDNTDIPVAGV